jgi:predicted amidohydrolase
MAKNLATTINDKRFDVFQQISDENDIAIGIGMPTLSKQGIHISTIIFKPNTIKRFVYSKQLLHNDELPYFKEAKNQPILSIKGLNIALGICYETLQIPNFIKAKKEKADIFIASVAKAKKNTEKAFIHFPNMAQEFNMPVLMANSIGGCDDFLSNGKSAVWNNKGDLIAQLDSQGQGIITVDTKIQNFEIEKF